MTTKFTKDEFDNAKSEDFLLLECEKCKNNFLKKKKMIKYFLVHNHKKYNLRFCSAKCQYNNSVTSQIIACKNCGITIVKVKSELMKQKNNFCSQSCAATYNNQHKTKGTRVSKLEVWLQEQLTINYPELDIHYNRKDAINSELDIYIPSLKLAFELNGIFHYEPIYGQDKLSQIQNNDDRKFQACLEKGIEFVIIDTSSQKYFKEKTSIKFFNIIDITINNKLHCSAEGT